MTYEELIGLLPEGTEEACWETKAMSRHAGIQDPYTLLKLCLLYGYDHSLIEVAAYAKAANICRISDVGFMKRFSRCTEWFKWIIGNLKPCAVNNYQKPEQLEERRVLAADATDIVCGGKQRQEWHLHYALDLFSMSCQEFKVTPEKTGEKLTNFDFKPKDLVLGDRVYSTINGMEHCLTCGADFILRMRNKAFTLYNKDGEKLDLADLLADVGDSACDIFVYYKGSDKSLHHLRICAVRKSHKALQQTVKKLHRKQSKKQIKFSKETHFVNQYFFVITSLDGQFSAEQILDLYRLRWQVEMVFKRYKTILKMGTMPTRKPESGEAWLNCKMLIALIMEKLMSMGNFSPSAQCEQKSLEGDEDYLFLVFKSCFCS